MLKDLIIKLLRKAADDIDGGNCNLTEEDMLIVYKKLQELSDNNSMMTKYEACHFLNGISRATFDRIVARGDIPKGHTHAGSKELYWNKYDLLKYKETKMQN